MVIILSYLKQKQNISKSITLTRTTLLIKHLCVYAISPFHFNCYFIYFMLCIYHRCGLLPVFISTITLPKEYRFYKSNNEQDNEVGFNKVAKYNMPTSDILYCTRIWDSRNIFFYKKSQFCCKTTSSDTFTVLIHV